MSNNIPFLELNEATVKKNGQHILHELSLLINTGEQTAIIGPNGSGKSTFIKLLTHQLHPLEPDDGPPPVRVFGKKLWNVQELRSRMGIVSNQLQREFLNNLRRGHIRGIDVVVSGFFSSLSLFPHQRITDQMWEKAHKALNRIESDYLSGYMLDEMSTGEVQRVLIARALVTEPQVLVLDEPTTGLDMVARHQCLTQIRNLIKDGTTIVLVTHHIEEIFPEIERVVFLKDGQIAFDGSKEEMFTSETLSQVFDHPLELLEHNGFYKVNLT